MKANLTLSKWKAVIFNPYLGTTNFNYFVLDHKNVVSINCFADIINIWLADTLRDTLITDVNTIWFIQKPNVCFKWNQGQFKNKQLVLVSEVEHHCCVSQDWAEIKEHKTLKHNCSLASGFHVTLSHFKDNSIFKQHRKHELQLVLGYINISVVGIHKLFEC